MKQPQHMKNPEQPKWATEIPGRQPMFKVHRTLGHAKNAISNKFSVYMVFWSQQDEPTLEQVAKRVPTADLYEWDGTRWVHRPDLSFSPETVRIVSVEQKHFNGNPTYWKVKVAPR